MYEILNTKESILEFRNEIIDILNELNINLIRLDTNNLAQNEIKEIIIILGNIKGYFNYLKIPIACDTADILENYIKRIPTDFSERNILTELMIESCSELIDFFKNISINDNLDISYNDSDLQLLIKKLSLFLHIDEKPSNNSYINKDESKFKNQEKQKFIKNIYPVFDYSEIDKESLEIFIIEAEEMLDSSSDVLLVLEKNRNDKENINKLFRVLHTLKGSSGMIKMLAIYNLCHSLEELLDLVRNDKIIFSEQMFDIMFAGLDKVSHLINRVKLNKNPNENIDDFLNNISDIKNGKTGVFANNREKNNTIEIKSDNQKDSANMNTTNDNVTKSSKTSVHQENENEKKTGQETQPQTLRIDIKKLDMTMNRMGELVIEKIKLQSYVKEFLLYELKLSSIKENIMEEEIEKNYFFSKLMEMIDETVKQREKLTIISEGIDRLSAELQDGIMKMRLVSLSQIFSRFPRVVRDLSKQLNKKINFVITGEETEIDKNIIERLVDPLIHLIRNSIDHGIESEAARAKTSKKETGFIKLSAYYKGNDVIIQIDDDGNGINVEKVKNKCVEKKLITLDEADKLSNEEIMMLIFTPGFSTADKVTDLSGRGVGMDVVKRTIESLNGEVSLKSEYGKFTSVIISIPLTLAIMQVLLIKIGNHSIAIPLYQIQETVFINKEEIYDLSDKLVFNLRGAVTPLIVLKNILGIENNPINQDESSSLEVVVVPYGDKHYGLLVDKLEGKQEIVIKNLGTLFEKAPFVNGSTTMGDGSVILILDIISVIKNSSSFKISKIAFETSNKILKPNETSKCNQKKSVLIVDDSASVRIYLKKIFQNLNIDVDEAEDGISALNKAMQKQYDILTIDLAMPVMDGLELCEKLRKLDNYKSIPFIAISGKNENKSKNTAFEKGMTEYIVKPPEKELIEIIVKKSLLI